MANRQRQQQQKNPAAAPRTERPAEACPQRISQLVNGVPDDQSSRLCCRNRQCSRRIGRFRRRKDNHARGSTHDLRRLPRQVKASLQRVPGVTNVVVSAEDKTAVVTYDDSKAQVEALVKATTNAGYPSAPKS